MNIWFGILLMLRWWLTWARFTTLKLFTKLLLKINILLNKNKTLFSLRCFLLESAVSHTGPSASYYSLLVDVYEWKSNEINVWKLWKIQLKTPQKHKFFCFCLICNENVRGKKIKIAFLKKIKINWTNVLSRKITAPSTQLLFLEQANTCDSLLSRNFPTFPDDRWLGNECRGKTSNFILQCIIIFFHSPKTALSCMSSLARPFHRHLTPTTY